MGRKSDERKTQMIQVLGFLVSLLGSFESAWKLLEGFDARKKQDQNRPVCPLPSFTTLLQGGPNPRAWFVRGKRQLRRELREQDMS